MDDLTSVLIIGAGPVGQDATRVLARLPQPPALAIADLDGARAAAVADGVADLASVRSESLDAMDTDAVARLASAVSADMVLHLGHNACNVSVMSAAVSAGAHYVDVSSSRPEARTWMEGRPHELHDRFVEAGVSGLSAIGNSPGLTNLLAMSLASGLTEVEAVDIWTAWSFGAEGSDEALVAPYRPLYSAALELQAYLEAPTVWQDGRYQDLPPFSGIEQHEFPAGLGTMAMVPYQHDEPWSLPRHVGRGVQRVRYHYPVNPQAATLVLSGLAGAEPVEIGGVSVRPVDVVTAVVGPSLAEQAAEAGAEGRAKQPSFRFWTEVEVRGRDEHGEVRASGLWTLDTWAADAEAAFALHERVGVASPVAGFCAVVAARLAAAGHVPHGVATAEVVDPNRFFEGMAQLGLPMRVRLTSSRLETVR